MDWYPSKLPAVYPMMINQALIAKQAYKNLAADSGISPKYMKKVMIPIPLEISWEKLESWNGLRKLVDHPTYVL